MKWVITLAIDSTKANSFLSRMHKSMGNSIINIEKERLYREGSSQEKYIIMSSLRAVEIFKRKSVDQTELFSLSLELVEKMTLIHLCTEVA